MARFDQKNPCPNCGSGIHIPKGNNQSCWGIGYDTNFICTREELSPNCNETSTGYLHYYDNCFCGKSHGSNRSKIFANAKQSTSRDNANKEYAESIWNESFSIDGSSSEDYLYSRGLQVNSDQLRHHVALKHFPSGLWCEAMIVRVSNIRNQLVGIERHYLDGGSKADVTPNKMSLGNTVGGSVKLAKLNGSGILGIAEGVITALTLIQELDIPVWACLGAKSLYKVQLPPPGIIKEIRIYTDGDKAGQESLNRAGDKWLDDGYKVINCQAPESKDYNDILMEEEDGW